MRYDPDTADEWIHRFGRPNPVGNHPDIVELGRQIVLARIHHGDGHPTTEALRDQFFELTDRLEHELGVAA